jgi:hypothetical protein
MPPLVIDNSVTSIVLSVALPITTHYGPPSPSYVALCCPAQKFLPCSLAMTASTSPTSANHALPWKRVAYNVCMYVCMS